MPPTFRHQLRDLVQLYAPQRLSDNKGGSTIVFQAETDMRRACIVPLGAPLEGYLGGAIEDRMTAYIFLITSNMPPDINEYRIVDKELNEWDVKSSIGIGPLTRLTCQSATTARKPVNL